MAYNPENIKEKSENILTASVLNCQLAESRVGANYFIVGKMMQANELKDE